MICRPHNDGWLLISQPAHAWMAGKLAAAWGNEQFPAPNPCEAVILATRLHDIGWLNWDAAPRLGNDKRPVNFLDTTLEETSPIWRHAVEWVRIIDPLAGLLVSMHATTVYRRRLERAVDPPQERNLVQKLIDEQEDIQAGIRSNLIGHVDYGDVANTHHLTAVYRWLRVSDLLSLAVLAGVLPKEGHIHQVPASGGKEFTTIHYHCRSPFNLEINPWVFSRSEIQIPIQARYLKQERFDNQTSYHSAIAHAPWQTISVKIKQSS
jgi:hypothetical protein